MSIKSSVLDNGKITTLREVKTSSPIDIVTIDEVSNSKKPKKKGWWSTLYFLYI